MKKIDISEPFSTIKALINERQSFEICGIETGNLFAFSQELEKYIESLNLKCRLYTKNRLATGLSAVLNPRWGILSLAAIAAHNLLTLNPDCEIYRDLANKRVGVVWKKKISS